MEKDGNNPKIFLIPPYSLPCILCNRNGHAKMSRQTEVHTLCRQCHIRKALSSRLENVLKSRLYMWYVHLLFAHIYLSNLLQFHESCFCWCSKCCCHFSSARNISIVIPRLQSIRHEESWRSAFAYLYWRRMDQMNAFDRCDKKESNVRATSAEIPQKGQTKE